MTQSKLWVMLIMLQVFAGACQVQSAVTPSVTAEPAPTVEPDPASPENFEPLKQARCPDLDSRLFQLTQANRPLELAQQWQLKVKDDKIQVLLMVDGEDTSFLQDFDVELGTKIGSKVQVFAPVNQLCALANTPQVLAIRPPTQVFTQ